MDDHRSEVEGYRALSSGDVTHTSEIDQLRIDLSEARRQLARLKAYNGAEDIPGGSVRGAWALFDRTRDFYKDELRKSNELLSAAQGDLEEANKKIALQKTSLKYWRDAALERWDWWEASQRDLVLMRTDRDAAECHLEEARKIVWGLITAMHWAGTGLGAFYYKELPRWLRKEIER
jgi:hypothetical protein